MQHIQLHQPIILLDAFGTLFQARRSIASIYHQAACDRGIAVSLDAIASRFPAAFAAHFRKWKTALPDKWRQMAEGWAIQPQATIAWLQSDDFRSQAQRLLVVPENEMETRQRWQDLVHQVLGGDEFNSAALNLVFDQLWFTFAEPGIWQINPDVRQFLQRAQTAGRRLMVASNFDQRLLQIVGGLPELQTIERVFYSSEIGCSKPDLRFYQRILDRLQVRAQQVVMIGDSWWEDYAAPTACGIHSIFVQTPSPLGLGLAHDPGPQSGLPPQNNHPQISVGQKGHAENLHAENRAAPITSFDQIDFVP